jgi:thiamine biosynthesis protein ThiI
LKSIERALVGFNHLAISKTDGRIYISQEKPGLELLQNIDVVIDKLKKVFGLVSISMAYRIKKEVDVIKECAEYALGEFLRDNPSCTSFKVQSKRSDKNFCMDSVELNMSLGEHLLGKFPMIHVNVHNPGVTVYLEVREHAYVYTNIIPASGGMPLATNGKAVLLLSGGIDSPVAGYMIAKRGVEPVAVHFYSFPYTGERSKQKVIDLCGILSLYCGPLKLYIVPFTQIQQEIYDKCPQNYLTIIMRRFMMEIAQKIALKENAKALVTGESIGQVASQTIDSLYVTDDAVSLPVFRPLIGMDKVEIMDRARNIGTYETSILPYEDCCTVFVPKNPAIYPSVQKAREAISLLDSDKLVDEAVSGAEIRIVRQ